MNATKLYIIMKALCNIVLTAGIIVTTCYLHCWPLLFFLILPACGMSMEVSSKGNDSAVNNKENTDEKI